MRILCGALGVAIQRIVRLVVGSACVASAPTDAANCCKWRSSFLDASHLFMCGFYGVVHHAGVNYAFFCVFKLLGKHPSRVPHFVWCFSF